MAETRQGFLVDRPPVRAGRTHDLAFFSGFLAFIALFFVLVTVVRPGSLTWAWAIVISSSIFSKISFIFASSARVSIFETMRIGVFTTISWIFFRLFLDWEESLTAAFSFLLTSPELSGYIIRAIQVVAGSVLFYAAAALFRPARLSYDEESSIHILPPVHEERVCEPPLMPIRPRIFPTTSPCLSRLTLPRPRLVLHRAEIRPRPLSVQPPHLSRRTLAVSPFLSWRL